MIKRQINVLLTGKLIDFFCAATVWLPTANWNLLVLTTMLTGCIYVPQPQPSCVAHFLLALKCKIW